MRWVQCRSVAVAMQLLKCTTKEIAAEDHYRGHPLVCCLSVDALAPAYCTNVDRSRAMSLTESLIVGECVLAASNGTCHANRR